MNNDEVSITNDDSFMKKKLEKNFFKNLKEEGISI